MIDHTGLYVSDYARSRAFYERALAPLGYALLREFAAEPPAHAGIAGFGVAPAADFWVVGIEPSGPISHVAFRATSRAVVDAFHAAAIAAGGRDNGPPGLRAYHPNYYGAFVLDPDGHNVEAVCHDPA
jgi:catechol 2,3-dioxygenase-like lactoylglutathione lyase family enzyme